MLNIERLTDKSGRVMAGFFVRNAANKVLAIGAPGFVMPSRKRYASPLSGFGYSPRKTLSVLIAGWFQMATARALRATHPTTPRYRTDFEDKLDASQVTPLISIGIGDREGAHLERCLAMDEKR